MSKKLRWHQRPEQKRLDKLDAVREARLAERWQEKRDPAARDILVRTYLYLADQMAYFYRGYVGFDREDIVSVGQLALVESMDTFNPEKGRFDKHAQFKIRVAVQQYIMDNWSVVNVWNADKRKIAFFNLARVRHEVGAHNGFTHETAEQAATILRKRFVKAAGMTAEDVLFMAQLMQRDTSLNMSAKGDGDDEGGSERIDFLEDENHISPEEYALLEPQDERVGALRDAINSLEPRLRLIINRHRLAEGEMRVTLKDLAESLAVSAERVRQLERKALRDICAALDIPFNEDIMKDLKDSYKKSK